MKKSKKIAVVLIAIVALMATFVISSSAWTGEMVGVNVPSISCYVEREDDTLVRYGRVTSESLFLRAQSPEGIVNSVYNGDITASIRTRWRLNMYDDILRFQGLTNNKNVDILIHFGTLPLWYNGQRQELQMKVEYCYNTTNTFGYELPESEYMPLGDEVQVVLRGYAIQGANVYKWSKSMNYDDLVANGFSMTNGFSDYVMQTSVLETIEFTYERDENNPSYGESAFIEMSIPNGFEFANRSNFGIDEFNQRVIKEGILDHFDELYQEAYDEGYDEGIENAIEERGFFAFIIDSLEAFFSYPLFDLPNGGHISLGLLLGVIVGALVFVWILKLIAGG